MIASDMTVKLEQVYNKLLNDNGIEKDISNIDTTKTNGVVLKQSIDPATTVDEKTGITITVNKLAEIKKGTVKINLKSIMNYTKPAPVNGVETTVDKKKVTVKVTSAGSEDIVYEKENSLDSTAISVPVQGVGTITVKLYVADVLKGQTQMDLNSTSTYTFE